MAKRRRKGLLLTLKKKNDFIKHLKTKVNKNIESLRGNERALKLLRTEGLKRIRLKEKKQIELVRKKAQKEQKALIERFDKKAALMSSKLLMDKQRQTSKTLKSETNVLRRNQSTIKNINKKINTLFPVKFRK